MKIPIEADGEYDVYYTYTLKVENRDGLRAFLMDRGIETKIHHPILMPEQPAYRSSAKGEWQFASEKVKQVISIPASEVLSDSDVQYIAHNIIDFYKK
ncbi:hypothetical protein MTBBW1_2520005 [Desulfamplus magnetovallimortis]|uniref:Uncharacterized protein n=1 Tax=Desulfamplus magnetovallimortis TaxID=1246637 RepID=A0A1W1HEH6_9BACT|nr:hypothetical protein MTBBW1_2520005 [Desulfamplus magnetovallimortis]